MTEKLYYEDSHLKSFTATALSCTRKEDYWLVELDKTAFFPEGGGQKADSGLIGNTKVFDVHEKDGRILHYTEQPVKTGIQLSCQIDWELRFKRMQNHSGEHIVSGIVNKLYGYENIGFHMGEDVITIDFNGYLDESQLKEIELLANKAVYRNFYVKAYFPTKNELEYLEYRSKLDLKENVRIVEIENTDICACCAPHVKSTGEIGIIKILSSMKHRGGVRIEMLSGEDALNDYNVKLGNVRKISQLLSSKPNDVSFNVERILNDINMQKQKIAILSQKIVALELQNLDFCKNRCLFDDSLDNIAVRDYINAAVEKTEGLVGVFKGNDADGYEYIIGSKNVDLRKVAKNINSALNGRGGGSQTMMQGRSTAKEKTIKGYIENFKE